MDWSKTAFVFPGQGSQDVGMGADLIRTFPEAEATFALADEVLGFSLSNLCFNGPAELLNDTLNTQPALYVTGIALLRVLNAAFEDELRPAFVAGHSLGEFTALTAAGALNFTDGLRLVRERGRLMNEAGKRAPGSMAAILGLEADVVREICAQASQQTGQPLVLANDNCSGQLVISGEKATLELALPLATERGAKKTIILPVSVASHSPLMQAITPDFRQVLQNTPFTAPAIPVVGNVQAAPLATVEAIQTELSDQLTSTVRWTESVQYMEAHGVDTYIELGPKEVLTGLIKRISRSARRINLHQSESVISFLATEA
ncbi:MAG: ACP S-malonyltransferase [Chloroflexi bacterium]|nr:ACP S-malonyltransferase [Chloroflexota bacterium]